MRKALMMMYAAHQDIANSYMVDIPLEWMPLTELIRFDIVVDYVQLLGPLGFFMMMFFKKHKIIQEHLSPLEFERELIIAIIKIYKSADANFKNMVEGLPSLSVVKRLIKCEYKSTEVHVRA